MTPEQLSALAAWFERYTDGFRAATAGEQRNYQLKVEHTLLVRSLAGRLAASLGMEGDDRSLAEAIAICHDVGRFPQFRQYGTFNDALSINHAALSVRTLKREGPLDSLDLTSRTRLLQAVAMHNMLALPTGLDPELRRFALLIRDADKLDIWRVMVEYCTSAPGERASAVIWELPDTGRCSRRALEEVQAGRVLNRNLLQTVDDFKLLQLSWVFDLSFAESFRVVAERGYLQTLASLLPDQDGCEEAVAAVIAHLHVRQG